MSIDYASIAANALAALTDAGQDVTLRTYTAGTYDPATGTATPTTADTTRKGVIFDFGGGATLERGTLIQVGDKRLLLDAEASVSQQDHFVIGGVDYSIVSIGEVNPAGTCVLYDIHLRK